MKLANYCPYCNKRRYLVQEGVGRYRYSPKKIYKDMWRDIFKTYPLGTFFKMRCELCKRNLAVFAEHKLKGMEGRPIVLFLCSMADIPYDLDEFNKQPSCYKCPIPKKQREEKKVLWSK